MQYFSKARRGAGLLSPRWVALYPWSSILAYGHRFRRSHGYKGIQQKPLHFYFLLMTIDAIHKQQSTFIVAIEGDWASPPERK